MEGFAMERFGVEWFAVELNGMRRRALGEPGGVAGAGQMS
jgi:hypothetical protein